MEKIQNSRSTWRVEWKNTFWISFTFTRQHFESFSGNTKNIVFMLGHQLVLFSFEMKPHTNDAR